MFLENAIKYPYLRAVVSIGGERFIRRIQDIMSEHKEENMKNEEKEAMDLKVKLLADLNTADNWYDLK